MAEDFLNETETDNLDEDNLEDIQETASFLKISELKLKCRARNLRLKENDIIVAVDGEAFHGSILEFVNILSEEDKKTLITIRRENVFFEVIAFGSLGSTFKFTSPEETIEIETALKEHKIFNIEDYKIFEVLRDLRRKTDILDTTETPLSWLLPPFWLIQNKLWEVLLVTISDYLYNEIVPIKTP